MSGRRLSSYRKGDWNEDLGILLLKLLAAVAPIPRQEDFGLDAIGTLLQPAQNNLVYAEESFYIQLKSESKKTISYRDHELDWLRNLQLPLFIGVVSRKSSFLNLFPAHMLNEFFVLRDFKNLKKLTIKLQDDGAKRKVNGESYELYIGPPLLTINIAHASDSSFIEEAYQILRKYLRLEHQNIQTRRLRFYRHIKWENNKDVSSDGHLVALRRDLLKDDLFDACESMVPGLELIKLYSESKDKDLAVKLNSLLNHLSGFFTTPEQIGDSGYIKWQDPFSN
jgi:hypothetical protein